MITERLENMKGGWFIGNFTPTAFKTDQFEVSYKTHKKNESWDIHFHKKAKEINLLVRGSMVIQGKKLDSGDIFIIEPYEIADPIFLEDCEIVCIKTPGELKDKYVINYI